MNVKKYWYTVEETKKLLDLTDANFKELVERGDITVYGAGLIKTQQLINTIKEYKSTKWENLKTPLGDNCVGVRGL